MDLSAFYELRARLQAGTVSGAKLAAEDFRLKRALEAMAPLEGAAPVFQKLGQLTRAFLAPECPHRAGALLDALSLADAIAVTQGTVAVPGEAEPLEVRRRGRAVTNAPYSLLSPLLEALTTSGGGRYSYVVDMHEQRPELFADYRVRDALVRALGASYSELAQRAEEWLSGEDVSMLPLLQEGFDPRGKMEMVRRVRVMEAVGGGTANDFFLEQLPRAAKDVRTTLIYALRHDPSNGEKLVELCKTEKGKSKDAAHWALSGLDTPEAREYWDVLAAKKPAQAAEYMTLSATEQASQIVAAAWERWLAPYEQDPQAPLEWSGQEALQKLVYALPGKSGRAVHGVYRRMARLGNALDDKKVEHAPGKKPPALRVRSNTVNCPQPSCFSALAPELLRLSLISRPASDLLTLAEELDAEYPGRFTAARITAALISKPADEVWTMVKPILKPSFHPFAKKERGESYEALCTALGSVCWDETRSGPAVYRSWMEPISPRVLTVRTPLREPLDSRIYKAMLYKLDKFDAQLIALIPTVRDAELLREIGEALYQRSLEGKIDDNGRLLYLYGMTSCGWTKCEDLAVRFCRSSAHDWWSVQNFLGRLPGDDAPRIQEAERVYELAAKGELPYRGTAARNPEFFLTSLEKYIDTLKASAPTGKNGR